MSISVLIMHGLDQIIQRFSASVSIPGTWGMRQCLIGRLVANVTIIVVN